MKTNSTNILKNQKGITLIELLIVMLIIGLLAGGMVLLINPQAQFYKGRDAQRMADLEKLQAALESYRAQNGNYPTSNPSPFDLSSCGQPFTDGSVNYINSVPCNNYSPSDNSRIYYIYVAPKLSDGITIPKYCLAACLEGSSIPQTTCNLDPHQWSTDPCNGVGTPYIVNSP